MQAVLPLEMFVHQTHNLPLTTTTYYIIGFYEESINNN